MTSATSVRGHAYAQFKDELGADVGSEYSKERFAETVMNDYWRRYAERAVLMKESSRELLAQSVEDKSLGYPAALDLPLGGRLTEQMTVGFLDLTNFTRRTFWDDQDDVVDLAHAVLSGFIEVVDRYGGHPLGLRGDGLFLGFGGPPALASAMALAACAFALDAVQTEVNPWLERRDLEPIQARAGLDAGAITFIRTGNPSHSEINPLGFAANFAAKCEKIADSWQIVVGEGLASNLSVHDDFTAHAASPKEYTRLGKRKYYHFYDFAWRRQTLRNAAGVAEALQGATTSSIISS